MILYNIKKKCWKVIARLIEFKDRNYWIFLAKKIFWKIRRLCLPRIIIHVYAVCWNEETILPYVLRHYSKIANKIFIYDNMSDDNSIAIIKEYPNTEIIEYDTGGTMRDDIHARIKNNVWKKSRVWADWVIVIDTDEILWHKSLLEYLKLCLKKGITIPVPKGFDMVSESLPTSQGMIYDEIKSGVFNPFFCKPCIFNPNEVYEINYGSGCHRAKPAGKIIFDKSKDLKLLHYKYLGLEYVLKRQKLIKERLSEINQREGWCWEYNIEDEFVKRFNSLKNKAVNVIDTI